METDNAFSHIDQNGQIQMVDVGPKTPSDRMATASCDVRMPPHVVEALTQSNQHSAKGSIVETAVIAGIMAAKKTSELIPLCHPLPIQKIAIEITPASYGYRIQSMVKTHHTTGVEMEALTAASIAALTVYDMCKAMSHDIEITQVRLNSKTGGKNDFKRD